MSRIKIYPPLLTLLLILAMVALHYTLAQPPLIGAPLNALGLLLIAGGVLMNLWSANWFRSKQTSIDPRGNATYLAQEGLYRISRNPMYLGMLITLLVWAACSRSLRRLYLCGSSRCVLSAGKNKPCLIFSGKSTFNINLAFGAGYKESLPPIAKRAATKAICKSLIIRKAALHL